MLQAEMPSRKEVGTTKYVGNFVGNELAVDLTGVPLYIHDVKKDISDDTLCDIVVAVGRGVVNKEGTLAQIQENLQEVTLATGLPKGSVTREYWESHNVDDVVSAVLKGVYRRPDPNSGRPQGEQVDVTGCAIMFCMLREASYEEAVEKREHLGVGTTGNHYIHNLRGRSLSATTRSLTRVPPHKFVISSVVFLDTVDQLPPGEVKATGGGCGCCVLQ